MAIDNDDEDDDGGGGQLVCPLFAYLIGLLLQCSAKIPAPRLPSSSWRARVISNFFLTDNFHFFFFFFFRATFSPESCPTSRPLIC